MAWCHFANHTFIFLQQRPWWSQDLCYGNFKRLNHKGDVRKGAAATAATTCRWYDHVDRFDDGSIIDSIDDERVGIMTDRFGRCHRDGRLWHVSRHVNWSTGRRPIRSTRSLVDDDLSIANRRFGRHLDRFDGDRRHDERPERILWVSVPGRSSCRRGHRLRFGPHGAGRSPSQAFLKDFCHFCVKKIKDGEALRTQTLTGPDFKGPAPT